MSSAPVTSSGETLANAEPLCTIRTCRETDLESILKIEKESFPDPYDREVFTMLLGPEPGGFLVAEDDGGVVGYVASSARYGLIFSLAVAANRRRRGIGSKLMEAVLRHLRGRTEGVSLQVRVGNLAAIALYRRFSFREEGIVRRYYPDGEDALAMSLVLRTR